MGVGALQGESKKKWRGKGKQILQINNILSLGGGGKGGGRSNTPSHFIAMKPRSVITYRVLDSFFKPYLLQ